MVDIHAHILPGVDDGPRGWDESMRMLELAAADGITAIAATPHVAPGLYNNSREEILRLTSELAERSGGLGIRVCAGCELTAGPEALELIRGGLQLGINGGRYVLLELPGFFQPEAVYDLVFNMTSRGLVPVIAHPERNPRLIGDLEPLVKMNEMGALAQVTAGSLCGMFGAEVRALARELVKRQLAHVLASDAHTTGRRAPVLSEGLKAASKLVGVEKAQEMVGLVPEKILSDEPFDKPEPSGPVKKLFSF